MLKLSDDHRLVLASAAKRANGLIYPLPKSIKRMGRALDAALDGLLREGLLAEQPAESNTPAWRDGENGGVTHSARSPGGWTS